MKKWFAICKPLGRERKMEKELEFLENDIVQRLLKSSEEVVKKLNKVDCGKQSVEKKVSRGQRAKVAVIDEAIGDNNYRKEIIKRLVQNTNISAERAMGAVGYDESEIKEVIKYLKRVSEKEKEKQRLINYLDEYKKTYYGYRVNK